MIGKINTKLLPLKFVLFFLFAAIGCLPAYLTIHMQHIGLTHEEITWINTVLPLTALVGPPIVGYLADRFGNYRLITIISMILAGLFHTALLFVPPRTPSSSPHLQMICTEQGSALVLQSCTETCPSVQPLRKGTFRISECRSACDFRGSSCNDPTYLSRSANRSNVRVDAETSLGHFFIPKICLHSNSSSRCDSFQYNTFVQIDTDGIVPVPQLERKYYGETEECCEYSLNSYSTPSGEFEKITCPSVKDCPVMCSVREITNGSSYLLQMPVCSDDGSNPKVTLWVYFLFRTLAEMFPAILISLFDAVALTMVAQHGGDYGRQKMFGLFAVGTSAPIVGYLMDSRIGVHGTYMYSPVFYAFDILLLVTAFITFFLPFKVEVQRTSMLKNMAALIRTAEFNLLLFLMVILGALNGYLETFIYMYLSEELGASKLLLGLTITVGIAPSVPFLYKSVPIVNYCGHHYLLMLAFVGYCIRFAGLSYIMNPLWVIPLEMLELFTINLMQVTAVTLAYKLAPKQLLATAQGLVWISHFDIGRALGTVIGGYLISLYGMVSVFGMACVFSAVCAGVYLFGYQLNQFLRSRRKKVKPKETELNNGLVMNGDTMACKILNGQCGDYY